MNDSSDDRRLGDYRLKELVAEGSLTTTWLAEQVSIRRMVLVDELRPEKPHLQEEFLSDIRAQAAVDHPLIGSVYEAVAEPGLCYYAHELLPGATFEERLNGGGVLQPAVLAYVLRRIAEANLYYEARDNATSLLDLSGIHLDDQGVIRLKNLAISGPRTPGQSMRDIVRLGELLPGLAAEGQPGTTRLLTLLAWMRGEELEAPISWTQVREYCEEIERQLDGPPTRQLQGGRGKKVTVGALLLIMAFGLVTIAVLAIGNRTKPVPKPPRIPLPVAALVPEGTHPTADGETVMLPAFLISAHEITIGEYESFLDTLAMLSVDRRTTFNHDEQPADKVSHEPTDWKALLAAAKSEGSWQGKPVTIDSPVVCVDWWDAAAYAEWKQARLPTQDEWFAALRQGLENPASIKPGGWMPVTAQDADRTPSGLIGMAGSVAEWTARPEVNPANPLGVKSWLIIGASYQKSWAGALSREWTRDRNLRRADLGFRLVYNPG